MGETEKRCASIVGGHPIEIIMPMTETTQRILKLATDAFDNEEKAVRWLQEPNIQTGNQRPIDVIETPQGLHAVEVVLNQIKYAVFA